jgi:hypothetical protein
VAGFDPDKYIAEKTASAPSGFDPDRYLSEKSGAAPHVAEPLEEHEKPGIFTAGLAGAKQGLTFGFADELGGGEQAALALLARHAPGVANALGIETRHSEELNPSQIYRAGRDENRAEDKEARDAHGRAYLVGNLVGGALAPVPGAGVAKGASLGTRVLAGAKSAAIGGGIAGLGNSDADLTKGEFGKAALDTAIGAGLGGLIGGALPVATDLATPLVRKATKPMAEATKRFANSEAVNAVLPMLKGYRKIGDTGTQEIGEELLKKRAVSDFLTPDEIAKAKPKDLIGSARSVRFGDNVQNINARLDPLTENIGRDIGGTLGQIDANATSPFRMDRVTGRAQKELVAPLSRNPVAARIAGYGPKPHSDLAGGVNLRTALEDLKRAPAPSFSDANRIKSTLDEGLFNKLDAPLKIDQARQLRGILNNEIEKQAKEVNPALAERFLDLKGQYSRLKPADLFAEDQALRQMANRKISPSDYASALADWDGGAGNKALAIATGGIHHVLRTRGAASAAVTADVLSGALRNAPETFGRYASTLIKAAQRGPQALELAHQLLLKNDPGYREQLEQGDESR